MNARITPYLLGITPEEFEKRKYQSVNKATLQNERAKCGLVMSQALCSGNCPDCAALRSKYGLELKYPDLKRYPDNTVLVLNTGTSDYVYTIGVRYRDGHYYEGITTYESGQIALCGALIWGAFSPAFWEWSDKNYEEYLLPMWENVLSRHPKKGVFRVSLNRSEPQKAVERVLVDKIGFKYAGEFQNPNSGNVIRDLVFIRGTTYHSIPHGVRKEHCIHAAA